MFYASMSKIFDPEATFYRFRLFRDNLCYFVLIKSYVNVLYFNGLTPQKLRQNISGVFYQRFLLFLSLYFCQPRWICLEILTLFKKVSYISLMRLFNSQKQLSRGVLRKRSWKYKVNLQENTHPKRDFNIVALHLYWNCTLAWMFSCKFAWYF